ncbi:MAG: hypothetical protein NZ929_04575 [Aigarchaeota archaeon]|nr:hypothetical protein [Aigarchaeota archaeon]MCX8193543.1 hypothetical protein [Nitrososphaeria archaeon]MDW7986683.1 hypothetical protein [Nitrososphaerota archaeon]
MVFQPRDHDFLETYDNWIFCIVGEVHPPDGYFAYPKYAPGNGPWKRGEQSFSRILKNYSMYELKNTLEYLKKFKPNYVKFDETISAEMFFTPLSEISKHYSCLSGLRNLLKKDGRDRLEQLLIDLVFVLHDYGGVDLEFFGLTGSILLNIHHERSDIDVIVYGRENFWKVIRAIEELELYNPRDSLERFSMFYPISRSDAEKLALRVRHKGYYRGVGFSVHGVRREDEINEKYGDLVYKMIGIARAELEVVDSVDSGFTPSVYSVEGLAEMNGESYRIERLTCYDLSYIALFHPRDRLKVYGKLEEVYDRRNNRRFYNILIGSIEAAGKEYIKLIS